MLPFSNFVKGLLDGYMIWDESHTPYKAGLEQVLACVNIFCLREPFKHLPKLPPVQHPDQLSLTIIPTRIPCLPSVDIIQNIGTLSKVKALSAFTSS